MTDLNELKFSDIYITADKKAFISDDMTNYGLKEIVRSDAMDIDEFVKEIQEGWDGKNSSYSVIFKTYNYRVEKTISIEGPQYCARKMPKSIPDIYKLGFPKEVLNHIVSLKNASGGLILWSGPTGSGKTTSISSLLCKYLNLEGGYAHTIEDPDELPLDGVYRARNGSLGLCKQTKPINDNWGASLKSALRSKPRYIMVGEIRTPDTASEVLRAASSGHIVLSTIHANNVADAINALVKYASAGDMTEDLAYDLLSRGVLGIIHQTINGGKTKIPKMSFVFANPDSTIGDQTRNIIKGGKINLATTIEQQYTKILQGKPIFNNI